MPNDQHLMAESDKQLIIKDNGVPCHDTLHHVDAKKEVSDKNRDFEMKSVGEVR
jgi:hypothetical protein